MLPGGRVVPGSVSHSRDPSGRTDVCPRPLELVLVGPGQPGPRCRARLRGPALQHSPPRGVPALPAPPANTVLKKHN